MILQNNQSYVAEFNITGLHHSLSILETNETNIKIQIKSFENSSDNNDWINKYLSLHSEKILEES